MPDHHQVVKRIPIQLVEGGILPAKAHEDDAGYDLYARTGKGLRIELKPAERMIIPVGFRLALPSGYEAQIRSRSGLAAKLGLFVLNSPGTVDAGFRGEVGVILYNASLSNHTINDGDRIAQMVINRLPDVGLTIVDDLELSARGEGGFGSSGR